MIGNQIRTIRKARKKTQVILAEKVGITVNYVSLIENDRRNPSLDILYKICDNLNSELRILPKL